MLKNVFRKTSSVCSLCNPGVNNPALLQRCQVLQQLCESGSLFLVNGAGITSFITWLVLQSPSHKLMLRQKMSAGCRCHQNMPGNTFVFIPHLLSGDNKLSYLQKFTFLLYTQSGLKCQGHGLIRYMTKGLRIGLAVLQ